LQRGAPVFTLSNSTRYHASLIAWQFLVFKQRHSHGFDPSPVCGHEPICFGMQLNLVNAC